MYPDVIVFVLLLDAVVRPDQTPLADAERRINSFDDAPVDRIGVYEEVRQRVQVVNVRLFIQ